MGVQDPARERARAPPARRCACSRRGRRRRLDAPRASRRGPHRPRARSAVVGGAPRPGQQRRLDPLLRRPGERRAVAIREDEDDLAAELAASARRRPARAGCCRRPRRRRRCGRSPAARPAASGQRRRAALRRSGRRAPRPAATSPTRTASGSAPASAPARRPARRRRTIPRPPLNVARISALLEPAERAEQPHHRRHRPAPRVEAGAEVAPGSARGTLPGRPPPVMWAMPRRSWPAARSARLAARSRRA